MTSLREGDAAPDVELRDDRGIVRRLADERGHHAVIYFYPRDATPGCTIEACGFGDANADLARLGVTVWGISPQSEASHGKFRDRYDLSFPLLVDADHEVAARYGAWAELTRYGKTYWGIVRSTFLVDPDGRIARVWPRVRPEGHAAAVLEEVRARLGASTVRPIGAGGNR